MQTFDELRSTFAKIVALYERGTWRYGPIRSVGLRLTSIGTPEDATVDSLAALIDYSRSEFGIDFDLQGGGIGCFDLVLGADGGNTAALENAIVDDPHFQVLLGEMNIHLARLHLPTGTQAYAGYIPITAGLTTNRARAPSGNPANLLELFGPDLGDKVSFGIAEFHVLDFADGESKASLVARVWKKVMLGLGDIRNKRREYNLVKLDLVDDEQFRKLVQAVKAKSLLVSVHGFANDFPAAMTSFGEFVYKTGLDRLGHFPVLFSWPSAGNPLKYLPETEIAANSQLSFAHVINLLSSVSQGRPLSVVAHSHGNRILLEVARDRANLQAQPRLSRLVFVEPDINARYMSERLDQLAAAASGLTFYHSENDMALAIAKRLFQAKRAGQGRISLSKALPSAVSIEVIDASRVASGLVKHSPHVDAAEVIYDIRDALEGKPAVSRGLIPSTERECWSINSIR
jgi:esterase/lipase superfamily enzyme